MNSDCVITTAKTPTAKTPLGRSVSLSLIKMLQFSLTTTQIFKIFACNIMKQTITVREKESAIQQTACFPPHSSSLIFYLTSWFVCGFFNRFYIDWSPKNDRFLKTTGLSGADVTVVLCSQYASIQAICIINFRLFP